MTWDSLRGDGVSSHFSTLESSRFGLGIGRVVVGVDTRDTVAAASALTRTLNDAPEDVLIVRWPSEFVGLGAAAVASGRAIVPADVLTYWEVAPDQFRGASGRDLGLEVVSAPPPGATTRAMVANIVTSSFRDYPSHYAANPLLDPELALAGYVEWAQSGLTDFGKDVLLMTRDERPIGLATLEEGSGGDLEILLCGLAAEAQGQGLYQYLLQGIAQYSQKRGHRRIIISTQAHNVRAQRVWARAGLRPFAAVTTVHALVTNGKADPWQG